MNVMKKNINLVLLATLFLTSFVNINGAQKDRQSYKIYVDKKGVMRRSDTKEEVSYYGTNYTLPFAHAYRAVGGLGVDRKDAINRDIYHMKRLGFNGFRLHLWDVELADSAGNLLQNDHLDLLDYMIAQLEKEGIDIILTAQTNFGNGYPEKNIDTGAFTYDYDKCDIHSNKTAQQIQANYLTQLAEHVNPYTGKSYAGDNAIIAMEINNEPCHTASKKEVTEYINKMVKALKKAGFDKPILYNVSHNPDVTEAYYDADIQGTTYQWYPTSLVAGHQRKGNFLPYVDQYPIPWKDTMKNYDKLARVVYEFDPGDVLYSYLYPAIARTFRKEGFQWITQFAYDPIDIAKYNTEYQTHFLNLAYTPSKALSMMIAGEAARNIPRSTDYGKFPQDTTFGDFTVSYVNDLSLYNTPEKFYYSNSNAAEPKDIAFLKNIAGVGSSKVIDYSGTGAYFLDEIQPGLWRLEVMPDVVMVTDPFEKPSLNREIGKIFYSERPIYLNIPQLGKNFYYRGINEGNNRSGIAKNISFDVYPGVYLISQDKKLITETLNSPEFHSSGLPMYVAPESSKTNSVIVHAPVYYTDSKGDLLIEAQVIGNSIPESVTIFPDYVSFWNDENTLIPMERISGNTYRAVIPNKDLGWTDNFSYNIVVNENGNNYTWPQNIAGTPLDWDFTDYEYYTSKKLNTDTPIILLKPQVNDRNIEVAMIPEAWNYRFTPELKAPVGIDSYILRSNPENEGKLIVRRFVGDELSNAPFLGNKKYIVIKVWPPIAMDGVTLELTGRNGITYSAPLLPDYTDKYITKLNQNNPEGIEYKIPLSAFTQSETNIVPSVYPSLLPRTLDLGEMPFTTEDIEFVDMVFPTKKDQPIEALIQGIWLE